MGTLASTERSLMDTGSVHSTGYQSKECTTAGLPTGLNYWRPQIVLLPTRITAGPPTGMNEKQCMVMYTCYDQGNQTTKLT